MPTKVPQFSRRRFLKAALSAAGGTAMAPTIIPSSALGLDGTVAPSERVIVGGIGIGNRGTYDLGCFLEQKDVQIVAVGAINAARAGKDMYCEKPCTKNIAQSLILAETMRRTGRVFQAGTQRRNLPHFAFACELARTGKLGKVTKVYAHPRGMQALMSGWLPAETEPNKEVVDWDMYLGPAAWRPFNARQLDGFNFEKGGGFIGAFNGGGVLEWG